MNNHNYKRKMQRIFIIALLLLFSASYAVSQVTAIAVPDGYAGARGTTGGGNAARITVSTASQFKSAVSGDVPAVVVVSGRINMGGDITVGSNKTIVGANTSSGLYGGAVKVQGTNYIFQNLTIGPHNDGDAMEISRATNVYINHCEFYDGADGNCDIVRGADYVTLAWCKFYYINQSDHRFSILIGNSDSKTSDEGKLHVTIHHTWFAGRVDQRMPRVRYGDVHLYNNYYGSPGNLYCIGNGYKSRIRVENSVFENVSNPWRDMGATTSNGKMGWTNLQFIGCSQPNFMYNSYPTFDLPYSFQADPVNQTKSMVMECAGNVVCNTEPDCNGDPGGSAYTDGCDRCVGGNTGLYECADIAEGYYTILPSANNLSLSASDDVSQQAVDNADLSQIWRIEKSGEFYKIYSLEAKKYLSVSSVSEGGDLSLGGDSQEFLIETVGNGLYMISPASNSGFVLDVPSCAAVEGLEMNLWSRLNNDCQRFSIAPSTADFDCAGVINGSAFYDNCGTCVGGNTGVEACATVQLEDACSYEGTIDSNNEGFAGAGFVNLNNAVGTQMSIKIEAAASGDQTIQLQYANGSDVSRPCQILHNGEEVVALFDMPVTGSWTTWEKASFSVKLNKGVNELTFISLTETGAANFDQLIVEPGITLADCSKEISEVEKQLFPLTKGWNLIGCPFEGSTPISDVLSSIWPQVLVVKDADGFWDSSIDPQLNSLTELKWGRGYLVKVSDDCVLEW